MHSISIVIFLLEFGVMALRQHIAIDMIFVFLFFVASIAQHLSFNRILHFSFSTSSSVLGFSCYQSISRRRCIYAANSIFQNVWCVMHSDIRLSDACITHKLIHMHTACWSWVLLSWWWWWWYSIIGAIARHQYFQFNASISLFFYQHICQSDFSIVKCIFMKTMNHDIARTKCEWQMPCHKRCVRVFHHVLSVKRQPISNQCEQQRKKRKTEKSTLVRTSIFWGDVWIVVEWGNLIVFW